MMWGPKNKWLSLPEVLTALRNVSSFQRTGQKNYFKKWPIISEDSWIP